MVLISIPSSVGVVRGYRLDGRELGVRFLAGTRNLYLLHRIHTCSEAHPAPYTMDTGGGALSLVVKQPGHEADG
jgi:hypothetical protein